MNIVSYFLRTLSSRIVRASISRDSVASSPARMSVVQGRYPLDKTIRKNVRMVSTPSSCQERRSPVSKVVWLGRFAWLTLSITSE